LALSSIRRREGQLYQHMTRHLTDFPPVVTVAVSYQ
jgi:hypothetical protein